MKISSIIHKKIEELLEAYSSDKLSETELISELHLEANGSSIIFSSLIEMFLKIAYDNGQIVLSKYLLKQYLQSEHKELCDYAYIGGEANEEIVIKSVHGISIFKGIFIPILEKLNLTNTLNAYIKYLIIIADEINESRYLSKQEIEQYSQLDKVINILFEEYDSKIDSDKKILYYMLDK
jgi:hypothetical protein